MLTKWDDPTGTQFLELSFAVDDGLAAAPDLN